MSTELDVIQLWTVQPRLVWERLQAHGKLTVDATYVENLHPSYEWLRLQLRRRVREYMGHFPWWAYCSRPDLRTVRFQKSADQSFVLLELDVPREQVLDFPAWAWDSCFYGLFLSFEETTSQQWQTAVKQAIPNLDDLSEYPEPWHSELLASWELLFDPKLPEVGWRHPAGRSPSRNNREAVFEVLDRRYVRQVTEFCGAK